MEIDILELSDRKAKIILKGVDNAFVNSLRRVMLSEVPTFAIDEVNIYENTSVLFDEQIALRLALIPLKTDIKNYNLPEECPCNGEGCTLCEVSLTLSAEGPKMVYSGDMVSADPEIYPEDAKIPIIELKEGQKLVLDAIARLGLGKEHAKWQAGIACGYKNMPVISITGCDQCGACITACPKNILEIQGNTATLTDPLECILCRLCEKACEIDAITVKEDSSTVILSFESDTSYTAKELIMEAANILQNKALALKETLQALQ
jgi:DNA-directed RNA polymerase subunit D